MISFFLSFVLASKPRVKVINSTFSKIVVGQPNLQGNIQCSMENNQNAYFIEAYTGQTPCTQTTVNIRNNFWKNINSDANRWGVAIQIFHAGLECHLIDNKFVDLTNRRSPNIFQDPITYGGAVYFEKLNRLESKGNLFENCMITDDEGKGGAIAVLHTTIINFESNTFTNCINNGYNGGAIYIECGTNPTISLIRNKFIDSRASTNGGGVFLQCEAINSCKSEGNVYNRCLASQYGAGIYYYTLGMNLIITNDTYINCRSDGGGAVGAGIATSLNGESKVVMNDVSFINCHSQNTGGGFANHNRGPKIEITLAGCLFDSCTANNAGDAIQIENNANNAKLIIKNSDSNRTRINGGSPTSRALISGYTDMTNLSYVDFTNVNASAFNPNRCSNIGIEDCTFTDCNQTKQLLQVANTNSIWINSIIFSNCKNLVTFETGSVVINEMKLNRINDGSSSLSYTESLKITNSIFDSVREKITIIGNGRALISNINLFDCFNLIFIDKKDDSYSLSVDIDGCVAFQSQLFEISNNINDCLINNINATNLKRFVPYLIINSPKSEISNSSFAKPDDVSGDNLIKIQQGNSKISNCSFSAKNIINLHISGSSTKVEMENTTFDTNNVKLISLYDGAKLTLVDNSNCIPKKFDDSIYIDNGRVVNNTGQQLEKFYSWNNKCFDETPPTSMFSFSNAFSISHNFSESHDFDATKCFSQSTNFVGSAGFSQSHQFLESGKFEQSFIFSKSNPIVQASINDMITPTIPSSIQIEDVTSVIHTSFRIIDNQIASETERLNAAQVGDNDNKSKFGLTAIIGIAVGGAVIIIVIIVLLVVCIKKKKKDDSSENDIEFETNSTNSTTFITSTNTFTNSGGTNPIFSMDGNSFDQYDRDFEEGYSTVPFRL